MLPRENVQIAKNDLPKREPCGTTNFEIKQNVYYLKYMTFLQLLIQTKNCICGQILKVSMLTSAVVNPGLISPAFKDEGVLNRGFLTSLTSKCSSSR